MARTPAPLTPEQARKTIVHRLGPRVDRIRQIATKIGVRPYRVFLVWSKFSGDEAGEGTETYVKTIEILPTPVVMSLDGIALNPFSAGVLPIGSVRLTRVSPQLTFDQLTGRVVPKEHEDHIPEPYDFFYEIMEDGRGDHDPLRQRFRLLNNPTRRAGKVDWIIGLERMSEDRNREGHSQLGTDIE